MGTAKTVIICLLGWIFVAAVHAESDPASILAEQTQRRQREETGRLAREQHFEQSQFERRLDRLDRKAGRIEGTTGPVDERRLRQRLTEIQQKEARSVVRREQALDQLEGDTPTDAYRQRQQLEQLKHRERRDAFIGRQNLRLRRSQLEARGRK